MSQLLEQLAQLSPEELEIFRRRLEERGRKKPALEQDKPIPRRDAVGPLPLAPAQLRVWLLDQLDPGSGAFHLATGLRLKGPLQEEVLGRSFRLVPQRHDALRLSFFEVGGRPSMRLRAEAPAPLRVHSLEELPPSERFAAAQEQARQEALRPFDLADGPLLRGVLYRLGPLDHLLVVITHHIVVDHVSMFLLGRELADLYGALAGGGALPTEPALRFSDWVQWQTERVEAGALEPSLAYWQAKLVEMPGLLDLPLDRPRGGEPFRQAFVPFTLDKEVAAGLEARAREGRTTLFGVMLTALGAALGRISASPEAAVGAVLAGRTRRELDTVLGLFFNPVVLRLEGLGEDDSEALLARTGRTLLEAQEHQAVPFERLVEELRPRRLEGRTPFFQVALNIQDRSAGGLDFAGLAAQEVAILRGPANLDLYVSVEEVGERIAGLVEYDAALFDQETALEIRDVFVQALEALARRQPRLGTALSLGKRMQAHIRKLEARSTFTVTANFSAELLEEPLRFWLGHLGVEGSVHFAPYQQIFQELLTPKSRLRSNRKGANFLLLRLEDWLRFEGGGAEAGNGAAPSPEALTRLEKTADDFLAALRSGLASSSVPCILALGAPGPLLTSSAGLRDIQGRWLEALRRLAAEVASFHLLEPEEQQALYPVLRAHDEVTLRQGHIPFTQEYFTALATHLVRRLHGLQQRPLKAIVLDCDGTLWRGVAAEDGVAGIELTAEHLALQRFMAAQKAAGRVLCLCSKNEEVDVWAVFDGRSDMVLRRQDLVAWRINWIPKPDNLEALARELNLGLDSFAFVDDNPVECAQVRASCPEVLVVQLPEARREIPRFLEHLWAFDTAGTTAEDERRTELYQQNAEREKARSQTTSLQDFLRQLELQVEIRPPAAEDLARLAQLTQRTNQFNARPRPRSLAEIQELVEGSPGSGNRQGPGKLQARIVRVRDRFGDYGLVGALLWQIRDGVLEVDTFLLSCRVLGRYVEHRMLVHLGEEARKQEADSLVIPFLPTPRNRPVFEFLAAVAEAAPAPPQAVSEARAMAERRYRLSAAQALATACEPSAEVAAEVDAQPGGRADDSRPVSQASPRSADSELLQAIATELDSVDAIQCRVQEAQLVEPRAARAPFVAPEGPIEEAVAEIWQELLRAESVGSRDDFFALGGHSLLGTVLLSRIRDAFDLSLDLGDLFRAPTLAALCQLVEDRLIAGMEGEELERSLEAVIPLSEPEARRQAEQEWIV